MADGAPPSPSSSVPEGWERCESEKYPGRFFFYNADTEESTWDNPGGSRSWSPGPADSTELFCSLCETEQALWHCTQCALYFCDECNVKTHHSADGGAMRYHTVASVTERATAGDKKKKKVKATKTKGKRRASLSNLMGINTEKGLRGSMGAGSMGSSPRDEIFGDKNVKMSEPASIWLAGIGTVEGTIKFSVESITDPASGRLRFVPSADDTGSSDLGRALVAAWTASTSTPRQKPTQRKRSESGTMAAIATEVFYALSSVAYQCIETSVEEEEEDDFQAPANDGQEPEPEPIGLELARTVSAAKADASSIGDRRSLQASESMLHVVIFDDEWDQSVTLRFFMEDDVALRCSELIKEAVQADVAKGHRSKRTMRLTKWLMHRKQRVPPEDASVRAGMGLTSRDDDVDPNEPETKSPKKSGTFNFTKTQVGPAPADAQTDSTSTAEDDADEMDSEFTTEIVAQVVAESKILTQPYVRGLHKLLPVYEQVNNWELLYGSMVHGISLVEITTACTAFALPGAEGVH